MQLAIFSMLAVVCLVLDAFSTHPNPQDHVTVRDGCQISLVGYPSIHTGVAVCCGNDFAFCQANGILTSGACSWGLMCRDEENFTAPGR